MFAIDDLHPVHRRQIKAANIKSSLIGVGLEDLDPYAGKTLEVATKWKGMVKDGKVILAHGRRTSGKGLLLIGKPGHGKTTLASAIVQDLIREMSTEQWMSDSALARPAYFTDYPSLLRMKQRSFREDDSAQLLVDAVIGEASSENQIRLLVLDDLGKEYRTTSGWAENEFDALLRRRHALGLPTIVTTNVPLGNWGEVYGESMESFAHEAFVTLEVVSPEGDRRV